MTPKRPAFAAACIGILTFGIIITVLGSLLPSLIEQYGIDKASAGSLFLLMSGGILVSSAFFGPIVDRFGYKALLVSSTVAILVGIEAIALAPSFGVLRGAVLLIGLAGGIINGAANALVVDLSEGDASADLSLLGVFFGIGAFGVPFVLGNLLDRFAYAAIVASLGGLVAIAAGYLLVPRYPIPKQPQGFPLARAKRMLKDPALLLFGAMLFLQSGMEITSGGWSATFFHEALSVAGDRSVLLLSLFWVGMVAARLVLGFVLRRVRPARALLAGVALALAGSIAMVAAGTVVPAAIGLLLLGAGLAAGFPVVLGYVGERYADVSGTALSVVFVMALTGGSVMPWLTGVLGEPFGLRVSFLVLPISLLLQASLLFVALRAARTHPPVQA